MPDQYKDGPGTLREYIEHGSSDPMVSHGGVHGAPAAGHDAAPKAGAKPEKGAH
jgi:hypothetical protein